MNSAEAGMAKSFTVFAQLKQTRFYRLQSVLIGRYLKTSLIYRAIAYVVRLNQIKFFRKDCLENHEQGAAKLSRSKIF